MMMNSKSASWLVAVAVIVAGCASSFPVPSARVVSSNAAIRSAREVGAEHLPAAALHLRLAQEQYASAQRLIAKGENERADWKLQRAQADAELALALSRENVAQAEAIAMLGRVTALQTSAR